MNPTFSISFMISVLIASVIASGCGGNVVIPESAADTVRERYAIGVQKLRADDVKAAEINFRRAIELNRKSPYGFVGMALLELKRGNYMEARSHAERALKNDNHLVDAHAVKGRVLTIQKKGKDWYENAMLSLRRAIEIDKENQQALYFAGECSLSARQYLEALMYYRLAAEQAGIYDTNISDRIVLLDKIISAGELSERGALIALDKKIDRGDLAILLVDECNIAKLISEYRPDLFERWYDNDSHVIRDDIDDPQDVKKNPAEHDITHILRLGIPSFDTFPDDLFYPDRLVARASMATVIQDVLAMLENNPMLTTIYIGSESPYIDVHPDFYAFNAIVLCTKHGIMQTVDDDEHRVNPGGHISGVDAILMLKKLRESLGILLTSINDKASFQLP